MAWLLPVLNVAPAYLTMVLRLRRGEAKEAVTLMLAWALALAVCGTITLALWPAPTDALVLNGPAYRDEMWRWIRTGEGREGDWRAFLPQHLGHLAAFVLLCLVTASAASMVMGAALMNFMGFYVASLLRAGLPASAALLFGWQPWAICRVAAFVILGVVLADPLLARLQKRTRAWSLRPWLVAAAVLIAGDWLLKALLAPTWGRVLRDAVP